MKSLKKEILVYPEDFYLDYSGIGDLFRCFRCQKRIPFQLFAGGELSPILAMVDMIEDEDWYD